MDFFLLTRITLFATLTGNIILLFIINYLKGAVPNIRIVLNFYLIGILGWTSGILINLHFQNLLIERFIFAFPVIILTSHFVFLEIFPKGVLPRKIINYILLFLPVFFLVISFIPNTLFTKIEITGQGYTILDQGPLSTLYTLFITLYAIYPIFSLAKRFRKETRQLIKQQMRYLLLAYSLFFIAGILSNLILPYVFNFYFLNGIGPVFSILVVTFIICAIVFYHLFDMQAALRLGAIYTSLFTIITCSFIFSIGLINKIMPGYLGFIIPSLLITSCFIPLKNFIENITDKFFFRRRYKFEAVAGEITHLFATTINIDHLLTDLINKISECLKTERAAIIIFKENNPFSEQIIIGSKLEKEFSPQNALIEYFQHIHKTEEINFPHKKEILIAENLAASVNNSRVSSLKKDEALSLICELKNLNFELAAPIFASKDILGVLLLGKKKSEEVFFSQDIRLIELIIHEAAISIENARAFRNILQLDETKSEFISVVSHQLRTPLSIVKWNTELILENTYGKIGNKKVKQIIISSYEGLEKLNEGLNNLLAALEIVEDKVFLNLTKFDFIENVFKESIAKYREKAKRKKVLLKIENAISTLLIEADRSKLKTALEILISNAITYTKPGGVVTISIQLTENNLLLNIEDEGIGISPENREAIFNRFFRGEEARKISPDGLGISLFIAKAFVEKNNGKLWLAENDNKSKQGSRFVISLPLKQR